MAFKIAAQEWTLVGDRPEEKFAFAQSVRFHGIEPSARVRWGVQWARRRAASGSRRRCGDAGAVVRMGHQGSHHFLADDFVRAVTIGTLPPVKGVAARFTLPGIVAHKSALRRGECLTVPDFGDAPTVDDPGA